MARYGDDPPMTAIRACSTDGYYEGETCPVCGAVGRRIVPASRRTQLSTFVSGALRHFPDDVGLELDERGWANLETVAERTDEKYDWFDPAMLEAIVAMDSKGRFELDEGEIRATYGHSVEVTLEQSSSAVPETLFHGTAPRNVDAIATDGLKPMNRQLVHLTDSVEEARRVGERHTSEPVVLRIDAAGLQADGWTVTKRGNHVFTVDRVPPEFLSVLDTIH